MKGFSNLSMEQSHNGTTSVWRPEVEKDGWLRDWGSALARILNGRQFGSEEAKPKQG